jgi:hypothetical protein
MSPEDGGCRFLQNGNDLPHYSVPSQTTVTFTITTMRTSVLRLGMSSKIPAASNAGRGQNSVTPEVTDPQCVYKTHNISI